MARFLSGLRSITGRLAPSNELIMNPSHVRERILMDHVRLRERLSGVEAAVDALQREPGHITVLVEEASGLLQDLVVHTKLEDTILGAALLELDAWGEIRAKLLRDHHEAQRRQLCSLLETYARPHSCEQVAVLTLAWVREVRADMHHEELDILSESLLRDDPIAVAMECG